MNTILQAMRKAGSTALRDMRSEARQRIRARKNLRLSAIGKVLRVQRPSRLTSNLMAEWRLNVLGGTTHVSDYPGYRQVGPKDGRRHGGGVMVGVNKGGGKTLIRSAFIATMASGHRGVFERVRGKYIKGRRQNAHGEAIRERLASRPVDALLHQGEAQGVAERGVRSFVQTFDRLAPSIDAKTLMPSLLKGRIA